MKEKLSQLASRPWCLPLIIVVLALGLRLCGVGWGLKNDLHNQSYHPDELMIWGYSQQIEPTQAKFTPSFYNYPTLYLTILRISSDVVAGYSGKGSQESSDEVWSYISRCHLAGRLVNVVAGALTALFCFLILLRWSNRWGAFMGGALIAFAPAHVVHSRFQTVDVLATAFLTISLFFILRLVPKEGEETDAKQTLRNVLLAAIFAGLSAGTKYTGGVVILGLVVALAAFRPTGWLKLLLGSVGAFIGTFLLTTPGVLLQSSLFWKDFSYEMQHTASGHGLVFAGYPSGFWAQFLNLLLGIGPLLVLMSMVGFYYAVRKRVHWALPVLVFAFAYYFVIGRSQVMFIRYTFPLYPVIAIGFGWLLGKAQDKGQKYWLVGAAGIIALMGLVPVSGLNQSLRMTTWMIGEDPRDTVVKLLKKQDLSNAVVGLATDPWFYTPPFYKDSGLGPANGTKARVEAMKAATNPRVARYLPSNVEERINWDQRLLDEVKPDYVAISSFEAGDIVRLSTVKGLPKDIQSQVDAGMAFIKRMTDEYQIYIFAGGESPSVHDLEYIRPRVEIWKRKKK